MESDIYKPPSAELEGSQDGAVHSKNALKYLVVAFLFSPLISSFAFVIVFFWFELETETMQYAVGLFVIASLVTYAVLLVFGLPIHWVLGIADWRKSYIYLMAGAALPLIVGYFLGLASEPLFLSALCAKGAFCSTVFWFIAVYLAQPKSRNKPMPAES